MKLRASVGYMVLTQRRENDSRQDHPDYLNQRCDMQRQARRCMIRLGRVSHDWCPESGSRLAKREGLAKALKGAHYQQGTALIIYSLDSIHLSPIESALLMLAFREWSVPVFEATTDAELTEQVGRWEKIVQASDPDARLIAERGLIELTKRATRILNKTKSGRKPFGESPEEKPILELIWKLRRKKRDGTGRSSYSRIANELNSNGKPPPQGKKWYAKTIQGIVKRTKPHLDKD